MARSAYRPLNAVQARRRLLFGLLLFGVLLALPVGFLLIRAYHQLRNEAFYQYQAAAIEVVNRINERVYEVLKPESERPFDQYSFWSVPQNALLPEETLNVSPLAQLALKTTVPGVIGYFQIDPDGSFHSPVLPEFNLNGVSGSRPKPLSQDEVSKRAALKAKLQSLLSRSTMEGEKRRQEKVAELKLDEQLYQQQKSLPERSDYDRGPGSRLTETKSLSQAPRKETLSYLEDARSYGDKDAVSSGPNEDRSVGKEEKRANTATARAPAQAPAPVLRLGGRIEKFEGEIYPIEFEILPSGDFSFYRKVWRDHQRYVQGFVVNGDEFLREAFEGIYQGSVLYDRTRMIVSYQGGVLRTYGAAPGEGGILVFRSPLAFPFGEIELLFSVAELPLGTGASLMNAMAVFLGLLIPGVLYGVYRLGSAQIELGQQRSNFVSAVSHELKTPLTSIRMYGEILRSGWIESEEKKKSYYDFIFFESERLSRLIANVLHLARLTNNDSPLELKPYPPSQLLDGIRSKVSSQVETAGFTLEVSAAKAPEALTVLAEEDAFSRIFINLVDNALKFSRNAKNKAVEIGYRLPAGGGSHDNEVAFFVRDFGPGIDRAQRKKLFQLFYRGENELTRTTPGTGIGLALVKELAAKMSAEVDLESKDPGLELTVRFRGSLTV